MKGRFDLISSQKKISKAYVIMGIIYHILKLIDSAFWWKGAISIVRCLYFSTHFHIWHLLNDEWSGCMIRGTLNLKCIFYHLFSWWIILISNLDNCRLLLIISLFLRVFSMRDSLRNSELQVNFIQTSLFFIHLEWIVVLIFIAHAFFIEIV